jgi:hypothetical protein
MKTCNQRKLTAIEEFTMINFDRMFNYFVLINLPKTSTRLFMRYIHSFCPFFSTSFNSLLQSFKLAEMNVMKPLNYAIQRSMNNRTALGITTRQQTESFSKLNMNCTSSGKEAYFEQILQRPSRTNNREHTNAVLYFSILLH